MTEVYSTYQAKAKFSELLRKVRGGKRVIVSHRGKHVAQIIPMKVPKSFEERMKDLEDRGILSPHREPTGPLRPVFKPGALKRFLESRD